jgi:4-carboxymuconolactone decarboxylase
MAHPPPRIPQITPEEWTDKVREVFGAMSGGQSTDGSKSHVLKTFAHHPATVLPFLAFNRHLLWDTSLPHRIRQIVILRTGWNRRANYVWPAHLKVSLGIGMSRPDFEAVKAGAASPHWSELERSVVAAVDQVCADNNVDDATWAVLAEHFERKQLMDMLFTIGTYMLVSLVTNVLRVEREPDLQALADEYGAP